MYLYSDTQEGELLLHPSLSTSFNAQQVVATYEDRETLISELKQVTYENILLSHQRGRNLGDGSDEIKSGLRIQRIIAVWCSIQKNK